MSAFRGKADMAIALPNVRSWTQSGRSEAASLWRPLLILRNSASVQAEAAVHLFRDDLRDHFSGGVLGLRPLRNISAAVDEGRARIGVFDDYHSLDTA